MSNNLRPGVCTPSAVPSAPRPRPPPRAPELQQLGELGAPFPGLPAPSRPFARVSARDALPATPVLEPATQPADKEAAGKEAACLHVCGQRAAFRVSSPGPLLVPRSSSRSFPQRTRSLPGARCQRDAERGGRAGGRRAGFRAHVPDSPGFALRIAARVQWPGRDPCSAPLQDRVHSPSWLPIAQPRTPPHLLPPVGNGRKPESRVQPAC